MANVRKYLDLCTSHLPLWFRDDRLFEEDAPSSTPYFNVSDSLIARRFDAGLWLWVPDDPVTEAGGDVDTVSPEFAPFLRLQKYARALDCCWILFDRDAEENPDLPHVPGTRRERAPARRRDGDRDVRSRLDHHVTMLYNHSG